MNSNNNNYSNNYSSNYNNNNSNNNNNNNNRNSDNNNSSYGGNNGSSDCESELELADVDLHSPSAGRGAFAPDGDDDNGNRLVTVTDCAVSCCDYVEVTVLVQKQQR